MSRDELLVNVIVPQAPKVMGVDLVAIFLGNPLSVILAEAFGPSLTEPPYEVNDPSSGKVHDVFALCIRGGDGIVIPLGDHGHVCLGNEQGALALLVPASVKGATENALKPMIAQGRARYIGTRLSPAGVGSLAAFLVTPEPNTNWTVSMFGVKLGFLFP